MFSVSYNTGLALLGASALGALCGMVGVFALLRRRALVGDVLAHATLPGLVLAFLITGSRTLPPLLLGALGSGLVAVTLLAWIGRRTKTRADAALALVLSVFFGAGIALSRYVQNVVPNGNQAGLDSFLLGKMSSVVLQDVVLILLVTGLAIGVILAAYKELQLIAFDPSFAQSLGWQTGRLDFMILALLTGAIVAGLPMAGVVLVAALTILPPLTARFWTHRLPDMIVLASLIGIVSAAVGVLGSAGSEDMPTGPIIILTAGAFFAVSALIAPESGLWARLRKQKHHRRRAQIAYTLRAMGDSSPRTQMVAPPDLKAQLTNEGLISASGVTPAGASWLRAYEAEVRRD